GQQQDAVPVGHAEDDLPGLPQGDGFQTRLLNHVRDPRSPLGIRGVMPPSGLMSVPHYTQARAAKRGARAHVFFWFGALSRKRQKGHFAAAGGEHSSMTWPSGSVTNTCM